MNYFCSSVGRKHLMAATGLGFSLFVLAHMAGNLLIFAGPAAYNAYSHALISNPFIYAAEAGLVALFLGHFMLAVSLTVQNRRARKVRYAMPTNGEKAICPASRTMAFHGLILLVFTIHHLITFKYGAYYEFENHGVVMRDLHRLVIEVFHRPAYVAWYLFCLAGLGLHLSHGFASGFQSIGVNHPRYARFIKAFGYLYAAVVALGFMAPPIWIFINRNS